MSRNATGWGENYRELRFEDKSIIFILAQGGKVSAETRLDLGPEVISTRFFKHDIPTEAEVEAAINYIEDELMSDSSLICGGEGLVTADEGVARALGLEPGLSRFYPRQEVEELFTEYALVSMGRSPALSGVTMEPRAFARILALREVLHHLNFGGLTVALSP
jgi:hypothetical protein